MSAVDRRADEVYNEERREGVEHRACGIAHFLAMFFFFEEIFAAAAGGARAAASGAASAAAAARAAFLRFAAAARYYVETVCSYDGDDYYVGFHEFSLLSA